MTNAEGGQPRLMITEMVLENFKSYAGAQRVGPFHKSFSSVVGPNGSGKSNVIDAMLFVFGKRAKQLRLNKVSELIHNSTNHRNLEEARVTVHFQEIIDIDDDNYEIIPNSDFYIARTAHRSNKSDYYINDRKSNFKEVTDMLKGKGIDLDNNRFLILQGEVEQISLMKPKGQTEHETGLLEYLEDIIGTDKYIPALEEGAKKLEELNEKRQSMLQRVKIAERERDALESEKTAAEAYLGKERECLGAQSVLAQIFVKDSKRNVDKIEANLSALEEKLAHEKAKFAEYNKVLQEFENKYNGVAKEYSTIQKDLDIANSEFKDFERKDIKYREDLKHAKTRLKKLDEKLQKDGQKVNDLEADIVKFEAEVPSLEKRAVELGEQLVEAEAKVEALMDGIRDEVEALRSQLRDVRAELVPWEKKITEVQGRIDVAAGERDLLVKEQTDAQNRLDDAKVSLKAAKEAATLKRKQAADMEAQVKKLAAQADKARATEAQAKAEVERLEGVTREVRGRVEHKKADANSRISSGAVVSALNEAKARKEIDGIFGRLGDLGAIDAKFDIAASTSCPALDYIVVDTTSTAQRCVELLRKRSLGVATFLILEKQQHLTAAATAAATPPEGVPRLFDLVSFKDERLRVAFYFAMRDTIVADDLEQASRIAYGNDKRWRRVVTLKGEMINESGTMTGGGGKPRGGRMCLGKAPPKVADSKEAATDLKAAEKELEEVAAALGEARHTAKEAAAQVKHAEKALAELETAIPKTKMEAEAAAEKAEDLENRMAELQAATKVSAADAKRLSTLEAEIKEAESELASLRRDCDGLSRKAAQLEQAIEDAGGEKLKRQRTLVTAIQKEQANCEAEATKKGVQANAARKKMEKLSKEVTKGRAEREKLAASQEATMAEFKALEDAAFKVLEVVKQTSEVLAGKEAELNEIREEFESRQKEVSIVRQVEADISNEIDIQKTAKKEEGAKLKHWTSKATQYAAAIAERDHLDTPPAPLSDDELKAQNAQELQYRVTVLEEEMQRMNIDLGALEVWRQKDAEYVGRVAELETATAERDSVRKEHDELRKKRLDGFMAGFNTISLKLKEMYQMITMGGDAELELVDSLDPFSEGIIFSVRPPKKSWKNIANLSGGEKTLSSLSLVFALHHYKPTPLYVMDEIDAALDFKNVSIVGHYIKERTKNAQFVIISLRNNMFELADRLVGIYKTDNCTKSVAVNPGEFAVGACRPKQQQQDVAANADQEQLAPAIPV